MTGSGTVTTVAGIPDLPIGTAAGGLPAKINSPSGLALIANGSSGRSPGSIHSRTRFSRPRFAVIRDWEMSRLPILELHAQ